MCDAKRLLRVVQGAGGGGVRIIGTVAQVTVALCLTYQTIEGIMPNRFETQR
jgi:hypothetical protein